MKQQLTIGVLAVLALTSFLLLRGLEKSLEPEEQNTEVREIATANQVKGRYYGANRQLQYEIMSDSVREFSNFGGTHFYMADLDGFDDKKQLSWQGRSDVALLSGDKNVITLTGNVRLVDAPSSDSEIRAYGEKMVYYADKGEVIGNETARVENDMMFQRAERFRLDMNKETVRFDEKVKGRYMPVIGDELTE